MKIKCTTTSRLEIWRVDNLQWCLTNKITLQTYSYINYMLALAISLFSFTLYPALSWVGKGNLESQCYDTPFPLSFILFRSQLSIEIWRHCEMSGGTQRRDSPRYQCEEMKILNISFPRVEIESKSCRISSRTLVLLHHDWPHIIIKSNIYNIQIQKTKHFLGHV